MKRREGNERRKECRYFVQKHLKLGKNEVGEKINKSRLKKFVGEPLECVGQRRGDGEGRGERGMRGDKRREGKIDGNRGRKRVLLFVDRKETKVKLGTYATNTRGFSAHLRFIGP